MAPKRKCCWRQLELLVEFCEKNTDLALGRFSGGPQGSQASKRAWEALACGLNAIGEGAMKTPEQWRRYWIELNAKVKGKAADYRRNAGATGGGPSKLMPLTEIDMRILALIGPVAVEGLHGVRIPINNDASLDTPSMPTVEPDMHVEWLDDSSLSPHSPLQQHRVEPILGHQENESMAQLPHLNSNIVTDRPNMTQQSPVTLERVSRERSHRQSRFRQHDAVPGWALDLEERRIAIEERQIVVDERRIAVEERMVAAIEELVNLARDIRSRGGLGV